MKFSRRDFLTFASFTVVGAVGGRYLRNQIIPMESYYLGNDFRNRKETFHTGSCGMCPAGCGILVRQIDGLPVKIDGNPDCPISRGKLCPKGQMGLELHYNPDRIASPLRRVGPVGSSRWQKMTWDEALSLLSAKIRTAVEKETGAGVAVLCNDEQSFGSSLWDKFHQKYAEKSRLIRINQLRDYAIRPALKMTTGSSDWPVYDIENSDFLLVFDTPLVSGWCSPTMMIGKYANFRRGGGRARGKMVFAGSRRSMDATNADSYIQVRPYTSAVLALGLAHVIIREHRYDEKFVTQQCQNFEQLKSVILKYFETRTVSEITAVPIETINSVARTFANSSTPIAIGERIPEPSEVWEQTAYLTLNALKGSLGRPGGIVWQEQLRLREIQPPSPPEIDLRHPDQTPLERFTSDVHVNGAVPDVLLVDKVNPHMSMRSASSWSTVLERIPFVVSFSPYPDHLTSQADLVLPDLGYLEKSSDLVHSSALGYPSIAVSDAAAPFIGKGTDTRIIQLHLVDDNFISEGKSDITGKEEQFRNMRADFHRSVFRAGRGLVYDTPFAREWVRRMEAGGWWTSETDNFEEFDRRLRLKGGWTDPFIPDDRWQTGSLRKSWKFDFKSVADSLPLKDILSLKVFPAAPEYNSNTWTVLTVVPVTLLSLAGLPYGNIPHLLEFPEPGVVSGWEPWLELHSLTASKLGLANEDNVEVESRENKRKLRVTINNTLHPDIGAVPFGMFGLGEGTWILENMKKPLESIVTAKSSGHAKGITVRIRKV